MNNKFDMNQFKTFNVGAPFVADRLMDYKDRQWNECLRMIGVTPNPVEKRERMITHEITAFEQQVRLAAESMLSFRQLACKEFNKMFNQNISVSLRVEHEVDEKEDDENGDLHNGIEEH
jgi:hypothetical protein